MRGWRVGVGSIKVFVPLRWDYHSTLVCDIAQNSLIDYKLVVNIVDFGNTKACDTFS